MEARVADDIGRSPSRLYLDVLADALAAIPVFVFALDYISSSILWRATRSAKMPPFAMSSS